jgi:hypothetical protein
VNPDLDHDAHRELEQRALHNASWLARKLGYQDAMDRKQERVLLVVLGTATLVIVALLFLKSVFMARADDEAVLQKRCEVDVRVQEIDKVRLEVAKDHAGFAQSERNAAVERKLHDLMHTRCPAK